MANAHILHISTQQDARAAAKQIAAIMRDGKPQTVNGFRFKLQHGSFVMVAGNVPALGDRFTVEQLGSLIWAQRDTWNASIAGHKCGGFADRMGFQDAGGSLAPLQDFIDQAARNE